MSAAGEEAAAAQQPEVTCHSRSQERSQSQHQPQSPPAHPRSLLSPTSPEEQEFDSAIGDYYVDDDLSSSNNGVRGGGAEVSVGREQPQQPQRDSLAFRAPWATPPKATLESNRLVGEVTSPPLTSPPPPPAAFRGQGHFNQCQERERERENRQEEL